MTREEFHALFQGKMLLALVEAWAIRHEDRNTLASAIERHAVEMRKLRNEMYDALAPAPKHETNGQVHTPLPQVKR